MLDKGSQSNANYNYFDIYFNDILKATPMKYDQFKFEIAFCLPVLLPLQVFHYFRMQLQNYIKLTTYIILLNYIRIEFSFVSLYLVIYYYHFSQILVLKIKGREKKRICKN